MLRGQEAVSYRLIFMSAKCLVMLSVGRLPSSLSTTMAEDAFFGWTINLHRDSGWCSIFKWVVDYRFVTFNAQLDGFPLGEAFLQDAHEAVIGVGRILLQGKVVSLYSHSDIALGGIHQTRLIIFLCFLRWF